MKTIRRRLGDYFRAHEFVNIVREFPGEPGHSGFVVGVGEELVLLHKFHDFYSEGLTALRIEDIQSVASGKLERFYHDVLRKEGLATAIEVEVNLTNMQEFLESLCEQSCLCIVECESRVCAERDDFYIGRILSVDGDRIKFKYFDSLARWGPKVYEARIGKVTKCQFLTPYIEVMSRYLSSGTAGEPKGVTGSF